MRVSILLTFFALEILFSNQVIAQRLGVLTGVGGIYSKRSYPTLTLGLNYFSKGPGMFALRLSKGYWEYVDEDTEKWSVKEISLLGGLKLENKGEGDNIYGLLGLGYLHHHYWTSYVDPPRDVPYDHYKIGLSCEAGLTLTPFSFLGFGIKGNGHITTKGWSSKAWFLFIEIGNLRKKES